MFLCEKNVKATQPQAAFCVFIYGGKNMEDNEIISMFMSRNENALRETQNKYGSYLYKIACNILGSGDDSAECVNDTYYKAWESIPPMVPTKLSTYLGALVRNISITMLRKRNAAMRAPSQYTLSLDELSECVQASENVEHQADLNALAHTITAYLRTLSEEARSIFMCRYYFNDAISEIATAFGSTESKIKSSLFRTRKGLKEYLEGQGFNV